MDLELRGPCRPRVVSPTARCGRVNMVIKMLLLLYLVVVKAKHIKVKAGITLIRKKRTLLGLLAGKRGENCINLLLH